MVVKGCSVDLMLFVSRRITAQLAFVKKDFTETPLT